MDKNQLWAVGLSFVMVLVLGLGFVLGVQPQLTALSVANEDRETVDSTNDIAQMKLDALKNDFAGIDALKAELATLLDSVPTGANAPALIEQLDALAKTVGVTLTSITVSDAEAYTPVNPPAAAVPTDTEAEGAEPAAEVAPVPAEPAAPEPGSPPVISPLITPANFAVLQVQVEVTGSYPQVLDFVNGLQTGKRLFLVTALSTTASSENAGVVQATIGGLVYAALTPDLVVAPAE